MKVTKVEVFFLVLVYVINFDLFEFLGVILEKGLLSAFNFVTTIFKLLWPLKGSIHRLKGLSLISNAT